MKKTCSILTTIKFSFSGPVSHEELQGAIGRALNTKQFRLIGHYTILDMCDETMIEVPKNPTADAAAGGAPILQIPAGAPIIQIGPKRT
jgi:hypothetical protein